MKKTTLIFLLLISGFTIGQNKIISIDTIINVENTSKDILYSRMHNHLTKYLSNQKQEEYLFKTEDKELGKIKIYRKYPHTTKIYIGSDAIKKNITYDYEVYFKDNKIRLVINGFVHPYLGIATTELPYPEENKPKAAGKKWFTKVYKEFVESTITYKDLVVQDALNAIMQKDKSEEEW